MSYLQKLVVKFSRETLSAMLAGSVFAIGLPQLCFNLAMQNHGWSNVFSSFFMGGSLIAIVPIVLGLIVLAIAIWRRSNNPYGFFSLGALLTIVGISLDFFSNPVGQFYFVTLAILYLILFILPRKCAETDNSSSD